MTITQIANRLIELCQKGEFETAQKELFAEDAMSIEPHETPGFEKETRGLKAIIEKGRQFEKMVEETYGISASPPLISGNSFTFALTMDMAMKGRKRERMQELCVYTVKDGKIISEQFFM